ncbi:MAG: HNH endonuclease, partial [Acidimicrobiia bacterium]|nr:HNH endonuclease [Acidimicrobiia bacterium]
DGTPLAVGTARSAIPPRTRRYVLARDGGCAADGCTSMTRLQPHHIRPRSQLGDNHPDNLATLCWFHHHVVIHGRGFRIDPDSPPQRRRFLPPDVGCNDPP